MRDALRLGGAMVVVFVAIMLLVLGFFVVNDPGSEEPTVVVTGGELETNESAAWHWTQDRMGQDADVSPWITITNHTDIEVSATEGMMAFERALVGDPPDDDSYPLAVAYEPDRVSIHEGTIPEEWNRSNTARIERMLVHEFAHLVQWNSATFRRSQPTVDASRGAKNAFSAVSEGSATYLSEQYTNRTTTRSYRMIWRDEQTSVHERYRLWPYMRGASYTAERIEGPDDFQSLYADAPTQEIAILRSGEPQSDGDGRDLDVELANYSVENRSSVGAAFVDSTLASAIGVNRSGTVAASMRSDRLLHIESDDGDGMDRWVWITEWNASSTADAFANGMEGYLDERWSQTNGLWTLDDGHAGALERVDGTTVALTVGNDQFLENVTVRSTDDRVVVDSWTANASTDAASATNGSAGAAA